MREGRVACGSGRALIVSYEIWTDL